MKFCPRCGAKNDDSATTCSSCKMRLPGAGATSAGPDTSRSSHSDGRVLPRPSPAPHHGERPASSNAFSRFLDRIGAFLGGGSASDLNWTMLFTGIGLKHSGEEAAVVFTAGTENTTPSPSSVAKNWPKPWLYSRVFLLFAAVYALLFVMADAFQNSNAFPGLMVVGSFAVPFTTLVLFMELNVWRNVSFHNVLQMFALGGAASLVCSLVGFNVMDVNWGKWQATTAAFVEEPGKAVIVWAFLKFRTKTPYRLLNGLLVGAAVGAGFAAFESAGYAFNGFLNAYSTILLSNQGDIQQALMQGPGQVFKVLSAMMGAAMGSAYESIGLRGLLAPGGHVAWAAIHGAAFSILARDGSLSAQSFFDRRYLALAAIPVVCHFLWNSPWPEDIMLLPYIVLIAVVWIVVLFLVNRGLAEVGRGDHSRVVA